MFVIQKVLSSHFESELRLLKEVCWDGAYDCLDVITCILPAWIVFCRFIWLTWFFWTFWEDRICKDSSDRRMLILWASVLIRQKAELTANQLHSMATFYSKVSELSHFTCPLFNSVREVTAGPSFTVTCAVSVLGVVNNLSSYGLCRSFITKLRWAQKNKKRWNCLKLFYAKCKYLIIWISVRWISAQIGYTFPHWIQNYKSDRIDYSWTKCCLYSVIIVV